MKKKIQKEHSFTTRSVRVGVGKDDSTGAISFPIYQSATFRHPAPGQSTGYDYSRSGNPTRDIVESALADLEGGARGLLFSSGMAAITAFLMGFRQGDHLIVSRDIYGGTYRLLTMIFSHFGISADFVDTTNSKEVEKSVKKQTRAILVETPGNPLMSISDILKISAISRSNNILLAVDNTFFTPALQRPIELGADIVIHSATKYLGGHNDLSGGALVTATAELGEKYLFIQNAAGSILSPGESWLLARSLKTLPLRMEAHCRGAMKIARWLKEHRKIKNVYYPGLNEHPGHTVCVKQASDFGGMISFRMESKEAALQCLKDVDLVSFAESLGGVETLITLPSVQTHADIPETLRKNLGITDDLLRLSVGLEDPDDIIRDLETAFPG